MEAWLVVLDWAIDNRALEASDVAGLIRVSRAFQVLKANRFWRRLYRDAWARSDHPHRYYLLYAYRLRRLRGLRYRLAREKRKYKYLTSHIAAILAQRPLHCASCGCTLKSKSGYYWTNGRERSQIPTFPLQLFEALLPKRPVCAGCKTVPYNELLIGGVGKPCFVKRRCGTAKQRWLDKKNTPLS